MKKLNSCSSKKKQKAVREISRKCVDISCEALIPTESVPPPKKKKNYDSKK